MPKPPKDLLTRKEWQQLRDQAGVKKGAVSKVSMGDALDKWHKARRGGDLLALKDRSAALAMDAKAYRLALKDADKKFGTKVETQVEQPALAFAKWVDGTLKELKTVTINFTNAFKSFVGERDAKPSTLSQPVAAVVKVLEDSGLAQFDSTHQELRKALIAHNKNLAADRVGINPDPLSGVNASIQQLVKRNKL